MKQLKTSFNDFEFNVYYIKKTTEAVEVVKKLYNLNRFGLDIETLKIPLYKDHPKAGLDPTLSRIRLVQLYDGEASVYVFDINHIDLYVLSPLLREKDFVAHNAKFEIAHFTWNGFPNMRVGCSMLMSQMVHTAEHSPFEPEWDEEEEDEEEGVPKYKRTRHSLDAVTYRLFNKRISKQEQVSDWSKEELDSQQLLYAGLDAVLTYKAGMILGKKILEYKMLKAYFLLKDMQHVVAEMELTGFPVNWKKHEDLKVGWLAEMEKAKAACTPFFKETNVRSSLQMGKWLESHYKDKPNMYLAWPRTPKGAYTFTKTKIFPYKNEPAIAALLNYKKYAKLLDTFGEPFLKYRHPVSDRIHTSFTLGMTRTGRMSSRDPNLQQVPRDGAMRDIFAPTAGNVFVVADFSQIELRIQAELSKDPVMRKVFSQGDDIYKTMAQAITKKDLNSITKEERQVGKVVMLALGYGMGPTKLKDYAAMSFDIQLSELDARLYWDTYHSTFRVYSQWCNRIRDHSGSLGFARTVMGKMRKLLSDEVYTKAPNTWVQGSALEVMLLTCIYTRNNLKETKAKLVNVVHDELIAECEDSEKERVAKVIESSMIKSMTELFPEASLIGLAEPHWGETWKEAKQ